MPMLRKMTNIPPELDDLIWKEVKTTRKSYASIVRKALYAYFQVDLSKPQ